MCWILAFQTGLIIKSAYAGLPLWNLEPLTATAVVVPINSTAMVQYRVTNQSNRTHTLSMRTIQGITQITNGLNICGNPFILESKDSCTLSLQINGSELNGTVSNGPIICQQGSTTQCYRPSASNNLWITQGSPTTEAAVTLTGSPLTLTFNGPTGQLIINNMSTQLAATNIASNFSNTALDGNVMETGNTCANVPPGGSCTLTYTPGSAVVPQTNFTIQGTNTNALTATIAIQSGSTISAINPASGTASGGTGFILTGTGLIGATGITFGGLPATSVNVVNSSTVTGVTPAHAAGVVDVFIDTPAGSATLTNGYTYLATAIGQASGGGTIACLNGGLNNLITASDSTSIIWGGFGTAIGPGAQSNTDGASNTTNIVAVLGNNGGIPYAAQLCANFEVDSQGNTPCQVGNTCYNDWFLPAGNNLTATGQLNCLFTNSVAIGGFLGDYWSSTEVSSNPNNGAWAQIFAIGNGIQFDGSKGSGGIKARCVRTFTP